MVTGAAARTGDYAFDLSGGRLCLDFANTVGDRGSDRPTEHLGSYGDFIAWAEQAGATTARAARALRRAAAARPAEAREALADCDPPSGSALPGVRRGRLGAHAARRPTSRSSTPRFPRRSSAPGWCLPRAASRCRPTSRTGDLCGAADAGRAIGGRPAGVRRCRSRPHLRGDDVRVAVPRHDEKPRAPLVRHEDLRQPREGAALPRQRVAC